MPTPPHKHIHTHTHTHTHAHTHIHTHTHISPLPSSKWILFKWTCRDRNVLPLKWERNLEKSQANDSVWTRGHFKCRSGGKGLISLLLLLERKLGHFPTPSDCPHLVWDEISWVCIYTHLFTVRLTTCWYYMKATADALFWLQPLSKKAGWKCLASHVSCCLIVSRVKTLPQPFASTWMYPKFQIQRYLKIYKFPRPLLCVFVCVCGGGQHIVP